MSVRAILIDMFKFKIHDLQYFFCYVGVQFSGEIRHTLDTRTIIRKNKFK